MKPLKSLTKAIRKLVAKEIGAWHKDHLDILNHLALLYELTDKYVQASQHSTWHQTLHESKLTTKSLNTEQNLTALRNFRSNLVNMKRQKRTLQSH